MAAEVKSGLYLKLDVEGRIIDIGVETARSSSVNVGLFGVEVGYEREIENELSILSAFED